MIDRAKQYMLQNYFGKHFPPHHRVYMIFSLTDGSVDLLMLDIDHFSRMGATRS
jgi:hypothetical protein